jgi:hypothetical protein
MKIYDKRRTGVFYSEHSLFDQWGEILGPYRLVVYLCIVSHSGYKTRAGFPSYTTIAHKCGLSRRKAIDCISDLCFLGFLDKEARESKEGDPDSNNYYILDIPEVEIVATKILTGDIPPKQQGLVDKINGYVHSKTQIIISPEPLSDSQTNTKNPNNINDVSPEQGLGVVHEVHQGGASHALGVVHEVHQGGASHAPEINTFNDPHLKHTYLHTPITPEVLKFDFNFNGLDEEQRMFVCSELNKLDREIVGERFLGIAQSILDEANYKKDRIKLNLAVYIKGLVTKANKNSFTPTHDLAIRRKKKALEAEKMRKGKEDKGKVEKPCTAAVAEEALSKLKVSLPPKVQPLTVRPLVIHPTVNLPSPTEADVQQSISFLKKEYKKGISKEGILKMAKEFQVPENLLHFLDS